MNEQLNVGLVGFGKSGRLFHAPFIHTHPSLNLRAVVERHARESKKIYPHTEIVRDFSELLSRDDLDLVVITTPNGLHFGMTRQALIAGKHIVVEKPFTISTGEARELIDLATEKELVLSVFQNRRWDGDFRTVQVVVEQGMLGDLIEYEAHFDRYRPALKTHAWKEQDAPGSGLLYDLGPHLIDQALCLFGLPETITADRQRQRPGSVVDDYFEVVLDYGEFKVILKAGMMVREPGPHFIIHGEKGSFIKYGMDPQEEALMQGATPDSPNWGKEPARQWGLLNTDIGGLHYRGQIETLPGCYQEFYTNVYGAISGEEELAVSPEQARDVIVLIELAQQSNLEGITVPVKSRE